MVVLPDREPGGSHECTAISDSNAKSPLRGLAPELPMRRKRAYPLPQIPHLTRMCARPAGVNRLA